MTDLRLRTQVEHDLDLVLDERPLKQDEVLEGPVDPRHPRDITTAHELGVRVVIADERDHRRSGVKEAPDEPRTDDAAGAGDQHGPARRTALAQPSHTLQGASPRSHRFTRFVRSRSVSIGSQNPSCRKAISCPS